MQENSDWASAAKARIVQSRLHTEKKQTRTNLSSLDIKTPQKETRATGGAGARAPQRKA